MAQSWAWTISHQNCDSNHQIIWFDVVINAIEILVEVSWKLRMGFEASLPSTAWVNSHILAFRPLSSDCAKREGSIVGDLYDPVQSCPSKFWVFLVSSPFLSRKLTLPCLYIVRYHTFVDACWQTLVSLNYLLHFFIVNPFFT